MTRSWRSRRTVLGGAAVVVALLLGAALVAVGGRDPGEQVTAGPPTTIPPPDEAFADVPDDHPLRDDVSWLLSRGGTGYADGTFRPDEPITRVDLVHLLWTFAGSPTGPFESLAASDAPVDEDHATAIAWAADKGMVTGIDTGTFRSQTPVPHEEAAAMLFRLSGLQENRFAPAEFTDIDPMGEHFNAISFLASTNIADGYADGTFRPTEPLTRIEAAMVLHRYSDAFEDIWPAPTHHHECTDPITPEQRAAADELYADTLESLARWPTMEDAEAAGFVLNTPFFFGSNAHMVNYEWANDGIALDPMRPESLMVSEGRVTAAMFTMENVREHGPMIGGCLTRWHIHNDFCFDAAIKAGGFFTSTTDRGCPAGSMLRITPEMFHVWVIKRAEGPFDLVENGM